MPSQMPAGKTLLALNSRLEEWAEEHPNVIVVPTSKMIQAIRGNEAFIGGRQQWPEGSRARFLQRDQLHPTLEGLIVLMQEAGDKMADSSLELDSTDFDFDLDRVQARLLDRKKAARTSPMDGDDG